MNKIINKFNNVKFMIFNEPTTIENYLVNEICEAIQENKGINLSIEARWDFLNIFNKLQKKHKNSSVSFKKSNFFMTDELVYDRRNWQKFESLTSKKFLEDNFLNGVDFEKENVYELVNKNNLTSFFVENFTNFDSLIDAREGLDIMVLKVHPDGSLIFNQYVDAKNLSTRIVEIGDNLATALNEEYEGKKVVPSHGATIGIDQIMKAKKIYLVAIGMDKSEMLSKLFFTKQYDKQTPLCFLKSHSDVVVLADNDACARILQYIDDTPEYEVDVQEDIKYDAEHTEFIINYQDNAGPRRGPFVETKEDEAEFDNDPDTINIDYNYGDNVAYDSYDEFANPNNNQEFVDNENLAVYDNQLLENNQNMTSSFQDFNYYDNNDFNFENNNYQTNENNAGFETPDYYNQNMDVNSFQQDGYYNINDNNFDETGFYNNQYDENNSFNSDLQLYYDEYGNSYFIDENGEYQLYQQQ